VCMPSKGGLPHRQLAPSLLRCSIEPYPLLWFSKLLPLPLQAWESAWFVRLVRHAPSWLLNVIADLLAVVLFNRVVLW
jgi:hypothetical protein